MLQSAIQIGRWRRLCRLALVQPLTELSIEEFSISAALGYWRLFTVCTDTVSLKLSRYVVIDGFWSKLVNVMFGVPHEWVLLLFLL